MTDQQTEAMPLVQWVGQEMDTRADQLSASLPQWITYGEFKNMALMAISRTPKLAQCNRPSIYLSLLECARLGLYPDGRQAAIVPYKGQATLLPMVQGIIELMYRAPKILDVAAGVVYEGDEFEWTEEPSEVYHKPSKDPDRSTRDITHAYARILKRGAPPRYFVVDRAEIEEARHTSAASNSPAWTKWYGEQAKKVAVKRSSKYVDLTPEAQKLIEWDHAVYGDPNMEGSIQGPSEDYESQMVKAQTEAKLEDLRARMGAEADGKDAATDDPEQSEPEEVIVEGETEDVEDDQDPDPDPDPDPSPDIGNAKTRPYAAAVVRKKLAGHVERLKGARRDQKIETHAFGKIEVWQYAYQVLLASFAGPGQEESAATVARYLFGKADPDEWTGAESKAIIFWLDPSEDKGDPKPSDVGKKEAKLVAVAALAEESE